jgi:hypothetical protein
MAGGRRFAGAAAGTWGPPSAEGTQVFIGGGLIVLIIIIVLVVLLLRR